MDFVVMEVETREGKVNELYYETLLRRPTGVI